MIVLMTTLVKFKIISSFFFFETDVMDRLLGGAELGDMGDREGVDMAPSLWR